MTMAILLALAAVPLAAQSLDPPALPPSAQAIEVPSSAYLKIKYHFLAIGKQIYKCENGSWAKGSTPNATLYDMNSHLKVRHGTGPSWTMTEGKGTVKAIAPTAVHFASPDGVSIDWLKLDVDKSSRTGAFSDIEVIQRVYTGAGKAPASACSTTEPFESAYTAHYYFWKK